MTKSQKRPKPKPQKKSKPERPLKKKSRSGLLVGLSIAAVILSVVISLAPLTPVIVTAPLVLVLLRKPALTPGPKPASIPAGYRTHTLVVLRWVLTLLLTALVASAFVPGRVAHSFPFAASAAENMFLFVTGTTNGAPAGYLYLIAGMAAFAGALMVSAGYLGYVLWSVALGTSAVTAAFLYKNGLNLVQVTLVAFPPWQIAAFASALFVIAPTTAWSRRVVFRKEENDLDWGALRRYVMIAAGLFVLSLLLRLTLTGPYLSLVRQWTVL